MWLYFTIQTYFDTFAFVWNGLYNLIKSVHFGEIVLSDTAINRYHFGVWLSKSFDEFIQIHSRARPAAVSTCQLYTSSYSYHDWATSILEFYLQPNVVCSLLTSDATLLCHYVGWFAVGYGCLRQKYPFILA